MIGGHVEPLDFPAPKAPLDGHPTIHPPVPSSGALAAALPLLHAPRARYDTRPKTLEQLEAELDAAALAVAHAVNEVAGEVEKLEEEGDGEPLATMPWDAWEEIEAAVAMWRKTTTRAIAAMCASPAKPPHEEETGPAPTSPLGARRPREGTSPAKGEEE